MLNHALYIFFRESPVIFMLEAGASLRTLKAMSGPRKSRIATFANTLICLQASIIEQLTQSTYSPSVLEKQLRSWPWVAFFHSDMVSRNEIQPIYLTNRKRVVG